MNDRSRARSIAGWAIGWAIAASALWLWPAARILRASELIAAILAIGGGAVGIGVGAYLAASARAGSTAESRSPKAEAVVWAIAFAGAALFLTAAPSEEFAKPGEVNAVTWPPPLGQSHASSRSGIEFSPEHIHFFEAVPAFGAVGGFFATLAGARRRSILGDGLRATGAAAIWIVAVVAAAVALMIGGYVLLSTVGRALSPLSPIVSLLVATVMAGGLAGGVAGVIAEPWHQPAGGPSDADLATSA